MGEDLFWAIRGSGGNTFGIFLAWKVKLIPIPAIATVFTVNKNLEQNATKILHRWHYIAHKLPDDIFTDVTITKVDKLIPPIQDRFPEFGLVKENYIEMSWVESVIYFGGVSRKRLDILLDRNALP
ncbi:hypothetical protein CRYUN_Cryun19dG0077500 [Craigia yunnanensis]